MSSTQTENVIASAKRLVEKIGQTMTWSDRDKGFAEYHALAEDLKRYDDAQPRVTQRNVGP